METLLEAHLLNFYHLCRIAIRKRTHKMLLCSCFNDSNNELEILVLCEN